MAGEPLPQGATLRVVSHEQMLLHVVPDATSRAPESTV
jgi:hypothetical protein